MATDLLLDLLTSDPDDPAETWKTRLQDASFRAVPYHTESEEVTFGRRLEVNEYPDREVPHTIDLGGRARRFRITAFVEGESYDVQRDRLLAALAGRTAGELVTQRHGTHRVRIVGVSNKELGNEGRFSRINFEAVEAGINREPARLAATLQAVKVAAESAQEGSLTSFLLKVDDAVAWAGENLVDTTTAALDLFSEFGTTFVQKGPEGVALTLAARALRSDVVSRQTLRQAYDFAGTGSGILDLYQGLAELPDSALDRLRILEEMRHADEDTIGTPLGPDLPREATIVLSADALVEAANRAALADLVRQAAVIARGLALLEAALFDAEEIARLRVDFLGPIDEEIELAGLSADDDAYISLRELRTAVLADLSIRGEQIPDTSEFTPPATLSSLLLSQRLYGTGSREAEIVERVNPSHPGFIAGGVTIRLPRA